MNTPTSEPEVEIGAPEGDSARPMRADARRNRERILAAAAEVFAHEGNDASVADIARCADVGAGTLFRHFPTKRDLLLAVLEYRIEGIRATVATAMAIEDPWDALVFVIASSAELQASDRLCMQSVGPELLAEPSLQRGGGEMMADMRALVERAQRAGVVRNDLRAEDLPFLQSAIGGATVHCPTSACGAQLWRRYLTIILDGLRPAGATPLPEGPPTMAQLLRVEGEPAAE